MITQFIVSSAVRSLQLLRLSKYSKYLGAMAALLALRFIWLIGHDALWRPPPCGGPGFRSDASTEPAHTRHTQSEKRGRPHGWRGSTELQRTDASTTHLAERLLLGRQLLLWLGLHLRGVLHEHGLVHQILYEGAARGRQLLPSVRHARRAISRAARLGQVLYEGEGRWQE